jgi:hypothetical protein
MYLYRAAITLAFLLPFSLSARSGTFKANSSLSFIENKGQVTDQYSKPRKDIQFKLNAPGMDIFIGDGQIHYQWSKLVSSEQLTDNSEKFPGGFRSHDEIQVNSRIETYRLDVSLIGANKNAELITEDQQEYYENYYLPQYPDGLTAHSYKKIIYKNIYPNIDWVLYIANSKVKNQNSKEVEALKYDFIVHEGGNPKDIQIKYDGATSMSLLNNTSPLGVGGVVTSTPFGSITEQAPYSYIKETKQQVLSSFILKDNVLSFDIAPYKGELIIDPQLDWATYYGGSGGEGDFGTGFYWVALGSGKSVETDRKGRVYISGTTSSSTNIATIGSFQNLLITNAANNLNDGFIAKFKNDGARIWGTYFGAGGTGFRAIACDSANNVYAAGSSVDTAFGTPGIYQTKLFLNTNLTDGILVKFDSNGHRIWCTYYGNISNDFLDNVAIDAYNNVCVAGWTRSDTGLSTPGAYLPVNNSHDELGYIGKFDSSGHLLWGTFIQSRLYNQVIACDKWGNVYAAGSELDTSMTTPGAHQTFGGGYVDAYLLKFDKNGKRIWGTFFGGEDDENASSIACDADGNIYMAGATASYDSIATPGVYQTQKDTGYENYDAFVAKFDSSGQRLWGSYFGGPGTDDEFQGLAIDRIGDVCLTGYTFSKTNIASAGAWQTYVSDSVNGMFVKFDPYGQRLWSTFYGGEKGDKLSSVAIDDSNSIYLCGMTGSSTGISTSTGFQPIYGGILIPPFNPAPIFGGDMFLVKANADSIVYISYTDSILCINSQGVDFKVGYIVTRSFRPGNIFTAEISDSSGSFASPVVIGTNAATASDYINCHLPGNTILGNHYHIRIRSSNPFYISADNGKNINTRLGPEKPVIYGDSLLCLGDSIHLYIKGSVGVFYTWSGPDSFNSVNNEVAIYNVSLSKGGIYIVNGLRVGCHVSDTAEIKIGIPFIKPDITVNSPLCEGDTIRLSFKADTGKILYTLPWPNLHPILFTDTSVVDIAKTTMTGTYIVNGVRIGCTNADTADVLVKPRPVLTVSSNSPLTAGNDLLLYANSDLNNTNYYWTGPDTFSSVLQNPKINFASRLKAGDYIVTAVADGCSSTDTVAVTIQEVEKTVFILFPNPNNGSFTIKALLKKDQQVPLRVDDAIGQRIWKATAQTNKLILEYHVMLPQVADGIYTLRLHADGNDIIIPFVVKQ